MESDIVNKTKGGNTYSTKKRVVLHKLMAIVSVKGSVWRAQFSVLRCNNWDWVTELNWTKSCLPFIHGSLLYKHYSPGVAYYLSAYAETKHILLCTVFVGIFK